ncbi:MAG: C1 family peptidase [Alphaproteobacteria bacterium]|nr:C1 family peptidase [Alphaproteobacteria bacterium]
MSDDNQERVYEGVTKDPLDLRDLMYEGSLSELPFEIDNRSRVPIVLDQGKEGACTGFGLAAVVNFLFYNRSDIDDTRRQELRKKNNGVSARMLYEMAKRYDEWEGENYSGSSIRGAMKGWLRHGVCSWGGWPYDERDPGRLTPERQFAALRRPLGAYLRVRHLHLNQMHSALNEAGILYASASVHEGWRQVDPESGRIPYRKRLIGGHAFAIVGYDETGFWVQNSWGPKWGLKGFCHIDYDDWLENGYDCWVARLGVPTASLAMEAGAVDSRIAEFDYIPHESVVLSTIRPHFVNLGNDGAFSATGIYATEAADVDNVVLAGFKTAAEGWGRRARLLLYAHGGLNDEKASASRIASLLPYFLANKIYPIHFMWESGLVDSIRGIVQDAFRRGRFEGWRDDFKDRFQDLVDEAVELGARGLGRPVWSQMKQNAAAAAAPDGGARVTAERLKACLDGLDPAPELHLVGHSAGSIFHGHLVPALAALGIPIKSLTFYAPACTTQLFRDKVLPHRGSIERLTLFNLTDKSERGDSVGPVYNKSLLYLVSEAFETERKTPLLGMEAFLTKDRAIKRVLGGRVFENEKAVAYSVGDADTIAVAAQSTTHGGFDNDEDTLNATLRIVSGKSRLDRKF